MHFVVAPPSIEQSDLNYDPSVVMSEHFTSPVWKP
jgi:hypothetical protein